MIFPTFSILLQTTNILKRILETEHVEFVGGTIPPAPITTVKEGQTYTEDLTLPSGTGSGSVRLRHIGNDSIFPLGYHYWTFLRTPDPGNYIKDFIRQQDRKIRKIEQVDDDQILIQSENEQDPVHLYTIDLTTPSTYPIRLKVLSSSTVEPKVWAIWCYLTPKAAS